MQMNQSHVAKFKGQPLCDFGPSPEALLIAATYMWVSGPGLTIVTILEMMRSLGGSVISRGPDRSTNKSVDRNQTLANWIDGDEEAL